MIIKFLQKYKYLFLTLIPVNVALLLSGCGQGILNPKGAIASDQKILLIIATLLMFIVVIPVIILIAVFARKYHISRKNKHSPDWAHSVLLEIIWWGIPCIIIAILATITWISTHRLDPYRPLAAKAKTMTIQVVALNWKWLFIYPTQKIATINFVQFPVHMPVRFLITADAPMNAFMIPQLGGQIYAMAGMQTQLHLIANETGNYQGLATNYSGDGFSGMTFVTKVSSHVAFNQWVNTVRRSSHALTMKQYHQLALPSKNNHPEYFSSVQNKLFDKIMMKYMKPGRHQVDYSPKQEVGL